ncbi:MAG TPA: oxygen-independent coproporphyrinogen III oxidase [Rudaea sp.]|uniref:oxygen-independent coproporphyrinogen III oxidase n=1 Tax=Rudaea sp. TaxID=2136325 RepID=UPI002F959C3A
METATQVTIPHFDSSLIARHDVAGPRYTSYPTAPQFNTTFGETNLRAFARASNEDPVPRRLSLYVHVPFCLSPCFYCGCTRIITRDPGKAGVYLGYLQREIELTAPLFDRDRALVQLHFGGGTPNFLGADQMGELLESLAQHFTFSRDSDREFGIEIDPRWCGPDYVQMLAKRGFNRISVGIQDFDPAVQAAVNRMQSVEQTRAVLEAARSSGFRSTSVDLIYGLPKQTVANFRRTLDQVIALAPDRIAAYAYAHLPERFKAQRRIHVGDLPDAATRLALLGLTVETLTAAGYRYIGMDHFARPGDDLARAQDAGTLQRNFQGYSTHADCDLVGLGMSSISHVGASFSQNARDLPGYYAALDAGRLPVARGLALDDDDLIRADAIQQLMCHGTLDIAAFEARHTLDFDAYFSTELLRLQELANDGLIVLEPQRLVVTSRGRFLLRIIAMCFDAHLPREQATTQIRYSRAL